jgi:putative ubiquitin-RnfH superfamily antitoxin RatB of RatAB toxin-antitoxin module
MKPSIEIVYQDELGIIVHDKVACHPEMTVAVVLEIPKYAHLKGRKAGIYSKTVTEETCLSEGDRLEFYLPLIIDPKDARRLRAKKNKSS